MSYVNGTSAGGAARLGLDGLSLKAMVGFAAAAIVVGAATGVSPNLGVMAVALIALVALLVTNPSGLAHVLIASMFLEVIAIGGVTIARLLAPLAMYVIAMELIRGNARVWAAPPLFAAIFFSLWALATGFWTHDLSRTFEMLGSLAVALTYMVGVAALIASERDLRVALYTFAFTSMGVAVFSVASFAGLPGGFGAAVEDGRAQGGLSSPNYFAALQLVALPLMVVIAAQARTRWLRYTLYIGALATLGSVLTTVSRGGLFSLMVLLGAIFFTPWHWLFPSPRHKRAVTLVLLVAFAFFMSRPYLRYQITDRVFSLVASESSEDADTSGAGRTELWKAARYSIAQRPLLGIGFGAFYTEAPELLKETPGVRLELVTVEDKEVHNAYLGITTEMGVPGLAFFLALVVTMGVTLRGISKRAVRVGAPFLSHVANALLLSLLAWSISAFFIEVETARPLWVMVGLCLALGKVLQRHTQTEPLYRPEISN